MCGIVGKINFSNKSVSENELKKMADTIIHRGPDDEGYWINDNNFLGFGHRRLSIIDLSINGRQPMHYQNCTITYNGEIYNYLEIKSNLISKGYRFNTDTDTEVILAAYVEYGQSCVQYFDGMFAFAIWDNTKKLLFGARDRFGEKPYYYYKDKNQFSFASEMKALFSIGIPKIPSNSMIYNYLVYDVVENPNDKSETFYENIFQIPPSHIFTLNLDGEFKLNQYWELDITYNLEINHKEAIDKFNELFNLSISKRMRSDVELGSSFSGGLDSSSVVSTMINNFPNKKFNTFTARFNDERYDEGYFINCFKKQYEFISHNTWPNENLIIEELDKIFYHQEEPFGSTSIIAQWEVMKLAKNKKVTVLLDGQGADETIAGYYKYFLPYLHETFKKDKIIFKDELYHLENNLLLNNYLPKTFYLDNYFPKSVRTISNKIRSYRIKKFAPDLNKDFINSFRRIPSPFYNFLNLNDSLYFDTLKYGLGKLLRYSDRNAMAFSREVRLPYLSHELVEFVFSLPIQYKMNKGWSKKILRDSMSRSLPKEITWRTDKKGFQAPENWLRNKKIKNLINESYQNLIREKIIDKPVENKSWQYIMCNKVFN